MAQVKAWMHVLVLVIDDFLVKGNSQENDIIGEIHCKIDEIDGNDPRHKNDV